MTRLACPHMATGQSTTVQELGVPIRRLNRGACGGWKVEMRRPIRLLDGGPRPQVAMTSRRCYRSWPSAKLPRPMAPPAEGTAQTSVGNTLDEYRRRLLVGVVRRVAHNNGGQLIGRDRAA